MTVQDEIIQKAEKDGEYIINTFKEHYYDPDCLVEAEDDGESDVVKVFIGVCFDFYPSKKYYTPFSNSNLDKCPKCNGTGKVRISDSSFGICPDCNGFGSAEAYQDQIYIERLEELLEEEDISIESGEGDACDLYAVGVYC